MNYSKDEFYDLMEEVEAQHGEHLDTVCEDQIYKIGEVDVVLNGCRSNSLFVVPYAADSDGKILDSGQLQACAVDDDMARWPRFGGDRFGRD